MTTSSPHRLLLVEDDAAVARGLVAYLEPRGFDVTHVASLGAARRARRESAFAVIVLDWALPDGEGIELVRECASSRPRCPVVMLTARTELADRVVGLELGADDYVTKPFEPRELLARLHVQLRRWRPETPPTTGATGPFAVDPASRQATYGGTPLVLTRLEFDLLHLFVREAGRVFTREELLNQIWGYDTYPTTRTVDTHVFSLRQKTAAGHFATVRGVGYRFVPVLAGDVDEGTKS